jgi:hypothetical protein
MSDAAFSRTDHAIRAAVRLAARALDGATESGERAPRIRFEPMDNGTWACEVTVYRPGFGEATESSLGAGPGVALEKLLAKLRAHVAARAAADTSALAFAEGARP